MTGFSYKNFILQIIHGGIILTVLIFMFRSDCGVHVKISKDYSALISVILISVAFILGVVIDFMADLLESFLLWLGFFYPPAYHLLKTGSQCGITLAHHKKIYNDLYSAAVKNSLCDKTDYFFIEENSKKKNTNIASYLFQVAKNQSFRECSDYQKEQLESFFTLYIFSRNLAASIALGVLLSICFNFAKTANYPWIIFSAFLMIIVSLFSSYRYFLYYARILLGSTFKPLK